MTAQSPPAGLLLDAAELAHLLALHDTPAARTSASELGLDGPGAPDPRAGGASLATRGLLVRRGAEQLPDGAARVVGETLTRAHAWVRVSVGAGVAGYVVLGTGRVLLAVPHGRDPAHGGEGGNARDRLEVVAVAADVPVADAVADLVGAVLALEPGPALVRVVRVGDPAGTVHGGGAEPGPGASEPQAHAGAEPIVRVIEAGRGTDRGALVAALAGALGGAP